MTEAVHSLLAKHLPALQIHSILELGEGQENLAYEVNGSLVVRFRKEPDLVARADAVSREVSLLGAVASATGVPVPTVTFADAEVGAIAYQKLAGVALFDHPSLASAGLARELGTFVAALAAAPVETFRSLVPVDNEPVTMWLVDAQTLYFEARDSIPSHHRGSIEAFLTSLPPTSARAAELRFCHNDLGAEHVLIDPSTGSLTGILDWTDAAIGDPMYDLGLLLRDLGPTLLESMVGGYALPVDLDRVWFYARCAVLEDIAFGIRSGNLRYRDSGFAQLNYLFGPTP